MEQINSGKEVAPKLKDSYIEDPQKMFDKIVFYLRKMYHEANLVHGDLSEYNILNMDGEPVIIDISQSTPLNTTNADELLRRDIKNLLNFFRKMGIKTTESELYEHLTKI